MRSPLIDPFKSIEKSTSLAGLNSTLVKLPIFFQNL
jgi:hypothetical protein